MAKLILKDAEVYMGQYNMSGYMNALGLDYSADIQEATTFASNGFKEKLAGLKDVSFAHEGLWDEVPDSFFHSNMAVVDIPMSIRPDSAVDTAFIASVIEASYSRGASIGELLSFSVSGNTDGNGLIQGVLEFSGSSLTTSGASNGHNLGAVSSGEYLYAALHVTSVSGADSTLDVVVESDADNTFASPTTVGTFTQVGASASSELIQTAGPITDTWFRISYTIGGTAPSYDFVVALGIK